MTDPTHSPSRRGFLNRFRPKVESVLPESRYPRPPWARENAAFLVHCTQCHECIEACPQKVLKVSDEQEPGLSGLPILSLEHGVCDFCEQCVEACKSGALSKLQGQRLQAIVEVSNHCESGYGQPCSMCVETCESGALSVELNQKPRVDANLCSGCGECGLSCYSRAISMIKR